MDHYFKLRKKMNKIFLVFISLFAALVVLPSCTESQEKEARTENVDEPIYTQDSADTEALIDSLSAEMDDSLSFENMDELNELEEMEVERAAERFAKSTPEDSDTPDIIELEENNQ